VLYAINAFAHWISGIDVVVLMPKLTPIFGGLTVLIFYFLVYELVGKRKIALLSALVLSVLPFHVYQLSHASPLTVGHFFMMLSLLLFVKNRKNPYYIVPLYISTILLIMSHHLTTYFYVVSLIFIVFFENFFVKKWTTTLKRDVIYILLTTGLTFSYWAFVATPVYDSFMRAGLGIAGFRIGSTSLIILFYLMFFGSFFIIWLWRKFDFLREREPLSARSALKRFVIAFTICIALMITFLIFELPWSGFSFTLASMILSIPLLIVFSLVVSGIRYTRFVRNGFFIRGWLFGLVISFIYAIVTQSNIIFPHRHIEYLMYPIAIFAVYGLGCIFSDPEFKSTFSDLWNKKGFHIDSITRKIRIADKRKLIFGITLSAIIVTNAASVYPSHEALGQSVEKITIEDIYVITWMSENLDKNTTLVASDHRLERMAEAEGFNTTKDETIKLWDAENITEYFNELYGIGKNYSRITHIIIDNIMKYDVVHIGPKHGDFRKVQMTNETWTRGYDKFLNEPFKLVYRNESIEINTELEEPVRWAELYEINWSYIEEYYLS
jgi:hypothetical protein